MKIIIPGWSAAADNFAKLEKATLCYPILLGGEAGCLQTHRGTVLKRKGQRLVEVDGQTTTIDPNSVATTACGINSRDVGSQPCHLDSLRRGPVLSNGNQGPPLRESLVGQFGCHLRIPPLRERRIDLLAWLHAFSKAGKHTLQSVSTRMLYAMLLDSDWTGNEQGLLNFLSAEMDKRSTVLDVEPVSFLRQPDAPHSFHPLHASRYQAIPKSQKNVKHDWHCGHVANIPLQKLPGVALTMFFAAFHWSLDQPPHDLHQGTSVSSMEPLGNPELWLACSDTIDVAELGSLSDADLLTRCTYGLTPKGGWGTDIQTRLQKFRFLGASLTSLRSGIVASTNDKIGQTINKLLKRPKVRAQTKKRSRPLTDIEKEIAEQHYTDRMSRGEIAAKRGCSPQNISKTLIKVREILSQRYPTAGSSRSVPSERLDDDA